MNVSWRPLLREPLLQFLVVGALVYLAWRALAPTPAGTIVITQDTLRAVQQQEEALLGRSLTDEERERAFAAYIDDEVLLQEAYRRGYDKTDFRTRKRLLTVMRYTLDEPVPAASRAQLEAYFREHGDRFGRGQVVTFDQVMFAPGSDNLPGDLDAFAADLSAGADFTRLGDRGMSYPPPTLTDRSRSDLLGAFGPVVSEQLMNLSAGEWAGPLDARGTIVFVRVRGRRELPPPTFNEIESYLAQEYEFVRRREVQDEKIAELRGQFRIEIEEPVSP